VEDSKFEVVAVDGLARLGYLKTGHGDVQTPVFMPVGTNANVKLLSTRDLEELQVEIILSNSYHLAVKPGVDVIKSLGGLHSFMNWKGGILTDSGGFQIFSLRKLIKVDDEGVLITSPVDGSKLFLTPELSIRIQRDLGSDIVMVLDQCGHPNSSYLETKDALRRTHAWAKRSVRVGVADNQMLFGIAQGGMFSDLRRMSAQYLAGLNFDGYAVGGLSIGEPLDLTLEMTYETTNNLPRGKARYFMGGGSPDLIVQLVDLGVDMFDSVFPTRIARHGTALTSYGRLNVRSSKFKTDRSPIDMNCDCFVCRRFSRAYIHHLFDRKEVLGGTLLSFHNIRFMMNLMKRIRESILKGSFKLLKKEVLELYEQKKDSNCDVVGNDRGFNTG